MQSWYNCDSSSCLELLRSPDISIQGEVYSTRNTAYRADGNTPIEGVDQRLAYDYCIEVVVKFLLPYVLTCSWQGYDVATRRSFFIGIRRVILLVQVLELLSACVWQIVFPYGGVAGFVARGADLSSTTSGSEGLGDSDGRLGLALAAALGQSALYTTLLVFFGCDRVVLRAIRVTGWEHWGAATWALVRSLRVAGSGGKLSHVAAAAWLIGVASLCAYFGRQL